MKLIRVFPRKTNATPEDRLAYYGPPDLFAQDEEVDEVHISVAFTWDIRHAEKLADEWRYIAHVKIGGPAYLRPAEEFVAGRYLKHGYTITSRGCPNRCWFCRVWRSQQGGLVELPIVDGWNVQDDNLLACSEPHIRAVFSMLRRQPQRVEFTGGLEAARLRDWHVDLLATLRPRPSVFMAYDTPDDLEPLRAAGRKLLAAGFTRESHRLRCYVLIGYPGDALNAAEHRLRDALSAGFVPMAMLHRFGSERPTVDWRRLQREWARPAIIAAKMREGLTI